jgi:hypothetical protein
MTVDLSGSPERALWLSVIVQAIEDAMGVSDPKMSLADERRLEAEARSFLHDRSGYWCEVREEVYAKAGVDPDWLRTRTGPIIPGVGSVTVGVDVLRPRTPEPAHGKAPSRLRTALER